MRTRPKVLLAILAVLVAGCGGGGGEDAGTAAGNGQAAGAPIAIPVSVDARPDDFSASFFSYFPRQLTARPGDSVEFAAAFSGEPHTVAFGTVIDEALTAAAATPPNTPLPQDVKDKLAKAPAFFPPDATDLDADPQPAAAQPCFLANVDPPPAAACTPEQQEQPEFTGKERFYSSGFLPDEATFKMALADDIAPGTYQFMCLVDRTEMTGTLTVVRPDQEVPTPAEVRTAAQREIDEAVSALQARADKVRAITGPDAMAGAPEEEGAPEPAVSSTVNVFPDEVSIPAGGSVTWTVNGAHTIAFRAPEDARPIYGVDADGVVRANKKGANPANGPGMPKGGAPPIVDAGAYDGAGFRNSGLLVSEGDLSYKLTFTRAGTYEYRCLFHTDMEGKVKVG
ncbi:MAG: cupredoxin domain-containing protein [Actinomycetota bacterium]